MSGAVYEYSHVELRFGDVVVLGFSKFGVSVDRAATAVRGLAKAFLEDAGFDAALRRFSEAATRGPRFPPCARAPLRHDVAPAFRPPPQHPLAWPVSVRAFQRV